MLTLADAKVPIAPPVVVTMGVSGSGKSAVGRALAARLAVPFQEGDDLHPAANIAKLRAGVPLDDADRAPWLAAVADWIAARPVKGGGVVSCSALRRAYRDRLRAAGGATLRMILLDPPEATLRERLAKRQGHFMPASLLASQLATLERPEPDEPIVVLHQDARVASLVQQVVDWLATEASDPAGGSRPRGG